MRAETVGSKTVLFQVVQMVATLAMNLSSVSIITNSLRLRGAK